MPRTLQLTSAPGEEIDHDGRLLIRDVYDLDRIDLADFAGLVLSGGVDQRHLAARRDRISAWVRAGGRLLANGHPMAPYVDGLAAPRKLEFHGLDDLWLTETGLHPIWDGIDRRDLLLRTGVPGEHTFAELARIGVAGFYAHAYLVGLPAEAVAITGIGQGRLPVDVAYPLGAGEVVLHLGNDLLGFACPGTTAADLTTRILDHLEGR